MKTATSAAKRGTTPVESNGNGAHSQERIVKLPEMNIQRVEVKIRGVSPLMVLQFSTKAMHMMLDKQTGTAKAGRKPKDPLALFKESYYRHNDDLVIKSVSFKAACVNCANDIEKKQTEMRRALFIMGEWIKIEAPPLDKEHWSEWDIKHEKELVWEHARGCSMNSGMVRNATGVADVRFRSLFPVWSATIPIEFNASLISLEELMMLFKVAGFGNGVGEWRPASKESKTGSYGRWELISNDDTKTSSEVKEGK